jgi:hypothetical protein
LKIAKKKRRRRKEKNHTWDESVIPALGRLMQEDGELETSYVV